MLTIHAGDFEQYNWSTGETGQSIQVTTAGEYVLQVVDEEGCVGKDSIRVDMKSCDALLIFPNAFTPNHDGVNDVFRLRYPGHVSNYQLQVFDRWGSGYSLLKTPPPDGTAVLGVVSSPSAHIRG